MPARLAASKLAADQHARTLAADLFTMEAPVGNGKYVAGPIGYGVVVLDDDECALEHQAAHVEVVAVLAVRQFRLIALDLDLRVAVGPELGLEGLLIHVRLHVSGTCRLG